MALNLGELTLKTDLTISMPLQRSTSSPKIDL
jgi:hypothetical protein